MFDLDNPRTVPGWLPLSCFLLAGILYGMGVFYFPDLKYYALSPLPVGFLSLSIYLRTRKTP